MKLKLKIHTNQLFVNVNENPLEFDDELTVHFDKTVLSYSIGELNSWYHDNKRKVRFIREYNSIWGYTYYVHYYSGPNENDWDWVGIVNLTFFQNFKLQFFNSTLPKIFNFFISREIWCFIMGYIFDEFKIILQYFVSLLK